MLEQTRNQMSEMKLLGMLKTLDLRLKESVSHGWGSGDFLSALVTDEKSYREVATKKLTCECQIFVILRAHISKSRMQTLTIVPSFNPFKDCLHSFLSGFKI